jgi:peroxiredoxin
MKRSNFGFLLLAFLFQPILSWAVGAGDEAPRCALKTFKDGAPLDLSQYRGKVVFLDFWASWCGPCAHSMPFLDEMQARYKSSGFEVVGVNLDEERADADHFLEQHPIHFAAVSDPSGECPQRYGVPAMPSSYLIDRQGKIRHVLLGFRDGEREETRAKIQALLEEKP